MSAPWTAWQPLTLEAPPRDTYVLTETLDGGQAFRWTRQADGAWLGVWGQCVAGVRLADGVIEWCSPVELAPLVESEIERYLGGAYNLVAAMDMLPWRSDPHLATCLEAFSGLRILRQPFAETLLGFLCSATKQIVQIKQMLALMAERHGDLVTDVYDGEDQPVYLLPTWDQLAAVPEAELRDCLLGFRARYIHQTALFLSANPGWLEATEKMPYEEARVRLCTLPGVGEKVADCVLLFGAGRLEAFPVDVWILKAMANRYGLDDWKPGQVAQFGRKHFGEHAGLAQQYLFAYERRSSRSGGLPGLAP